MFSSFFHFGLYPTPLISYIAVPYLLLIRYLTEISHSYILYSKNSEIQSLLSMPLSALLAEFVWEVS